MDYEHLIDFGNRPTEPIKPFAEPISETPHPQQPDNAKHSTAPRYSDTVPLPPTVPNHVIDTGHDGIDYLLAGGEEETSSKLPTSKWAMALGGLALATFTVASSWAGARYFAAQSSDKQSSLMPRTPVVQPRDTATSPEQTPPPSPVTAPNIVPITPPAAVAPSLSPSNAPAFIKPYQTGAYPEGVTVGVVTSSGLVQEAITVSSSIGKLTITSNNTVTTNGDIVANYTNNPVAADGKGTLAVLLNDFHLGYLPRTFRSNVPLPPLLPSPTNNFSLLSAAETAQLNKAIRQAAPLWQEAAQGALINSCYGNTATNQQYAQQLDQLAATALRRELLISATLQGVNNPHIISTGKLPKDTISIENASKNTLPIISVNITDKTDSATCSSVTLPTPVQGQ